MADTSTTHLNLIKQDPNSAPDIDKEHTNLEILDTEVWARGKTFNGTAVGEDGGFHVRSVPYAENLETGSSQKSNESFIVRTSGGEASINDGDAWLMIIKGGRVHDGYVAQEVNMTVTPMQRYPDPAITAVLDEETFEAYVGEAGTYTVFYDGAAWDTSPTLYGLTVSNTPITGDNIVMVWDGENNADVTVNAVERPTPEGISATIDEDVFMAYVSSSSGTVTLTYNVAWSADPANYGITVSGTPVAGDVITVTYVMEVRGTITQSNPQTFVSTGWNLYNHENEYAKVIKYSDNYGFKISGSYTNLSFAYNLTDEPDAITPVSGGFNPFANDDPIGTVGYVFVAGGNKTDTAIWMTWSDWGTVEDRGPWEEHTTKTIKFDTFMGSNFPYGLMQVGNIRDEINLNVGIATSYIERQAYNSVNLAAAKASGREYEYDENYIYIERSTPVQYITSIEGGYVASDHGMEEFTGTDVAVYAETIYGANLKNKLERDVLTISQQTLTDEQKAHVLSNLDVKVKFETTITNLNSATQPGTYYYSANSLNAPTAGAGRVMVMKSSASAYGTQIAAPNAASSLVYIRTIVPDGFGAWDYVTLSGTLGTAAKLDVANNVTTTETGYVLDARRGKLLNDAIGTLNTSVSSLDTRVGNMECIRYFTAGTATAKTSYTITVPTGSMHYIAIGSNAAGVRAFIFLGQPSSGNASKVDIDVGSVTLTAGAGSLSVNVGSTARPITIVDIKLTGSWISVS